MLTWLSHLFNPPPPQQNIKVKEGAGATIDSLDEPGFRKITEDNSRQIQPHHHERMQKVAIYLWEGNLLANRLIELPLAYLLAEGVQLTCDDEEAQEVLKEFWHDPINDLNNSLEEIVRATHLSGVLCLPLFVNEFNGKVRTGYLKPYDIQDIIMDPDNQRIPIGIVTKRDSCGNYRKYKTVMGEYSDEELFTQRTRKIREQMSDGYCLYFRVNNLPDDARGRSDLLASADWVDGYDEFLFGELDRQAFLRAFIWDVTLKNATPEEVARRATEIKPPKPGSTRVHNDAEEWKAVSPDMKASDTEKAARLFKNHVLGGLTIPEHWYGSGGDVNRATASEMGDPSYKNLTMRQRKWKGLIEKLGRFVLAQHYIAHGKSIEDMPPVFAQFPELVNTDITKNSAAFAQTTAALGIAVSNNQLSTETAMQIMHRVAATLGVDFDIDVELEKIKLKADADAEADAYYEPVMPDDEKGDEDDTQQRNQNGAGKLHPIAE